MTKLSSFEYLLKLYEDWNREVTGESGIDFSLLKVIKLNFFTAAISSNSENEGLLDIFDDFVAMRLGPVESGVYSSRFDLTCYDLRGYLFTKTKEPEINADIQSRLIQAVDKLKHQNRDLITYHPMKLVDISHKWYSWKVNIPTSNIER